MSILELVSHRSETEWAPTENQDKCRNCGRFINPQGEAFYTRETPGDEYSQVVACCNEACADAHEAKVLAAQCKCGSCDGYGGRY